MACGLAEHFVALPGLNNSRLASNEKPEATGALSSEAGQ
jgi:hypothetical protein